MKKISIMIVISFVLSLFACSVAFAGNDLGTEETTVVINEYLHIKALQEKSNNELEKMGYSAREIKELKEIDYAEELKKRSQLDTEMLQRLGYTDEQISMLKDFQGTESEIIALSSRLYISGYRDEWRYVSSEDKTYFRVGFYWYWSIGPMIKMTDIVAAAWSPEMLQDTSSQTSHRVTYFCADSGKRTHVNYRVDVGSPGRGAYSKFPVSRSMWEWADEGNGWIRVRADGRIGQAAMKISYGHQTLTGTPSVSFPGGVTITFSSNVKEEDYAYVEAP